MQTCANIYGELKRKFAASRERRAGRKYIANRYMLTGQETAANKGSVC
jgi:hypothetical protein